ncbi:MAG: GGDEF domain-containing protein [Pseudomonadota bacterium]
MDASLHPRSTMASALLIALKRWFFNILNSGIRDGADIEVRYVNAITLIGGFNIIISVFIELSLGKPYIAGFMFLMAVSGTINIIYLRRSHNAARASTHVLLIALATFTVMLIDGMYQNTAVIWLAIFPAIAFFFKGKYRGMLWFGAMLCLLLTIMLLQAANLLHTPYSTPALSLVIASVVTVGMMVYVYESLRAKAEASLQQAREELHEMAHTDMLTGLNNRAAFYAQLPLSLTQANDDNQRLAVFFIDLDNFKPINDTYGHEVGDKLLQEAARRLKQQLRGSDFIARYGGDEFVAILPAIKGQREAGAVADKLIDTLGSPFLIDGHQCRIGVSIGIGFYPDCASGIDELVQLADHGMYTAKSSGKNAYVVCPVHEGEDDTPYKGKLTCNRCCPEGAACNITL